MRLAPGDGTLTDAEWETVAERLMTAVGIQQAGCRWVAVRHADDHIHLMATLVSETTGKRFHPFRDYLQLRTACRELEHEFGLTATAPADRTARPAPTSAERAKADRSRRAETPRDELHRLVSHAAATTATSETFLLSLRESGLDPRVRRDESDRIVGYSVALPSDLAASGEPVRYASRALAPDLTWPKLRARWAAVEQVRATSSDLVGSGVRSALADAVTAARASATTVRSHTESATATANNAIDDIAGRRVGGGVMDGEVESIAHAAGELLTATAARAMANPTSGESHPGTSVLAASARRYDRASRAPHRVLASPDHTLARDLRRAARRLAAAGASTGRGMEALGLTALVLALASLVAETAAWQNTHNRPHQAHAAQQTAEQASAWGQARNPFTARRTAEPPVTPVRRTSEHGSGLDAARRRTSSAVPPPHRPATRGR